VFDYCHAYSVRRVVFVGRHTYYGADADSPMYHTEAEPPTGNASFPELADLVAADLYAGSALWRYPELETVVLRVCYTLGASHHGTLASFLRGRRVPMVLGFDPLFHFMHEDDAASAIVTALERNERGVFNVGDRARRRTHAAAGARVVVQSLDGPLRPPEALQGSALAHQVSDRHRQQAVPQRDRLSLRVRRA